MADESLSTNSNPSDEPSSVPEESIHYVGERNAIVFSAAAGEPLPPLELPDDFFDLNKDDVRILFKELKQNREDLENRPLRTKAVRELEDSTSTLSRLNRYTRTVVRVQFPDRMVLQAVFNHSETVQTVLDFIQTFLDPPDVQFYLYTAPPKSILNPSVTLVDAKLTPRALVYFGTDPPQERTTYLRPSLLTSLTSLRLASEAALQYRRKEADEEIIKETEDGIVEVLNETPSCSYQKPNSSASKKASASSKVPKWFKK
uniref:UBX domain-containing protein n=1 Tax=Homalodisca liturata TaxID=320908 RepID=A0A1B6K7N0_9HEMI